MERCLGWCQSSSSTLQALLSLVRICMHYSSHITAFVYMYVLLCQALINMYVRKYRGMKGDVTWQWCIMNVSIRLSWWYQNNCLKKPAMLHFFLHYHMSPPECIAAKTIFMFIQSLFCTALTRSYRFIPSPKYYYLYTLHIYIHVQESWLGVLEFYTHDV